MPFFSIIIPFHNSASTLGATLKSVQTQSLRDWEVICIDDGGTDLSRDIANAYAQADGRITVLDNTGNGPSDARNFGVEQASADYIAFLDSDDLWTPNKLSTVARGFSDTGADALFSRIGFFEETPNDCKTLSSVPDRPLQISDLLAENPVCTLSNLVVKRSVFRKVGGFDSDIVHNEDLDFLIRVLGEGFDIQSLDTVLTWYRTSASGLSSEMSAMLDSRRRVIDTAFRYGVCPTRADDAVYMRYLARRALRLNAPHREAWAYVCEGLRIHPMRFLTPMRRGVATAAAAAMVRCLPSTARLIRS